MNTGEHPIAAIGEGTPVRLAVVIAVVSVAVAVALAWGVSSARAAGLEKEQDIAKAERKELATSDRAQELRIQRVEDAVQTQTKLLERIDSRLERMERGGVRPARHREEP